MMIIYKYEVNDTKISKFSFIVEKGHHNGYPYYMWTNKNNVVRPMIPIGGVGKSFDELTEFISNSHTPLFAFQIWTDFECDDHILMLTKQVAEREIQKEKNKISKMKTFIQDGFVEEKENHPLWL